MAHQVSDGRTATSPPSLTSGRRPARARLDLVPALSLAVTLAALIIRFAFLANQSYWTDETFSVSQASGTLRRLFSIGSAEIHTPFYALVLWVGERIGGTATAWTHGLSALFGLTAVATSYLGLRSAALSSNARWLAVALTAANGFGIVYSQESRPYALALLGATGLTAVTVTHLLTEPKRSWSAGRWLAWATLTATAHLLGAMLVSCSASALVLNALRHRRYHDAVVHVGLTALAVAPQLLWILTGLGRRGFAGGTTWVPSPRLDDLALVLTSVFSSGRLTPHATGFAWTSQVGVAIAVVLLVIALVLAFGRRAGQRSSTDATMGAVLLGIAACTLGATFVVSQVIHVWTLRNMIVVVPPLTWGIAWLIIGLPPRESARKYLAAVVLVATLVSLVPIARSLSRPYKTDWRALIQYLAQERADQPSATFSFFGSGPRGQLVAGDRGNRPGPYLERIFERVDPHPRSESAINGLRRIPGPQVVVYYAGVAHPRPTNDERAIMGRLADPGCRSVPIYGFAVITCSGPVGVVGTRTASLLGIGVVQSDGRDGVGVGGP